MKMTNFIPDRTEHLYVFIVVLEHILMKIFRIGKLDDNVP